MKKIISLFVMTIMLVITSFAQKSKIEKSNPEAFRGKIEMQGVQMFLPGGWQVYTVWATAPAGWEVTGVWQADPSDPVWGVNPDRSVTGNLSNGVWKDLWFGLKITGQDSDNDGFADGIEWYIGTDRLDNCPDNVSDPAWPPDISNSRKVDIVDVGAFRPVYLSQVGDGKYNKRFDLDADGLINTIDVGAMRPYFNKTCN